MKFFNRFKLVTVEVPKGLGLNDKAGRKALAGLAEHPGLQYLLNRIRLQRAALESALKYGTHADMKEVLALQAGIRWLTWTENQFLLAVAHPDTTEKRDPNQEEWEALAQSMAAIQTVGED